MEDAMWHLYKEIPGLYQTGFSSDTLARLFMAPNKQRKSAKLYHGVLEARVEIKRNDKGASGKMVHWARCENRLIREWHSSWGQCNISGDDMNIINVGRPAVSRYHHQGRWYLINEGPNHDIHDFPSAELGLKLGGYMFLPTHMLASDRSIRKASWYGPLDSY